jgi:antagonist of KipI
VSTMTIERPGMFTTVQDGGRPGFAKWGVPGSGPMDRWSARLANRLVGNPDGAPVLEATLVGPRLHCGRRCRIAVTGAEFDVEVAGRALRSPFVETVEAGDVMSFGNRHAGARAYIAVDGSFCLPRVLGSVSAHMRSAFAGLAGRALRASDDLALGDAVPVPRSVVGAAFRSWWDAAGATSERRLRILAAEGEWHTSACDVLCATPFTVSQRSDRMGYRLEGQPAWGALPGSLLSGATALGAIQVPQGGEPILLMADHQTTGGYAQVAVLCRADRQVAGQLAPGDCIRFHRISFDDAAAAHVERERSLARFAPEVPS